MNNTIVFYPGMLKAYGECPYKYKLKYIDKITAVQNSRYSEKGRKIHALANFYLKGQNIDRLEEALSEDERNLFQKLKSNPMFNKIYINSEYNLTSKVSDYWISGRIDALVKDGDGMYILDYKTGAIPKNPIYDFQTILYLMILSTYLADGNYENLRFVYIDLKNDKNIEIKLTKELMEEYKNIITTTCDKILKDKIFEPKSDRCKFCEYCRFCTKASIE